MALVALKARMYLEDRANFFAFNLHDNLCVSFEVEHQQGRRTKDLNVTLRCWRKKLNGLTKNTGDRWIM